MATLPSTPAEQTPKTKPKLPPLQLKPYSTDPDGISPSCSTPRNNVSWADNRQDILRSDSTEDNKMSQENRLPAPYIFKLIQLVATIICTVLYSEGLNTIPNNITSQLFPYIICSIYLIITPVILLSYVTGHAMPELIVRIFNALGGILFLVAGAVALEGYSFYLVTYKLQLDNYSRREDGETMEDEEVIPMLNRQGAFLLVSGILCLLNSVVYFLDVGWSIHVTLSSL